MRRDESLFLIVSRLLGLTLLLAALVIIPFGRHGIINYLRMIFEIKNESSYYETYPSSFCEINNEKLWTSNNNPTHGRVHVHSRIGKPIVLPVYSTHDLDEVNHVLVEEAVLVQHGDDRYAAAYYCDAINALNQSKIGPRHVQKYMIIAPLLLSNGDKCWYHSDQEQQDNDSKNQTIKERNKTNDDDNDRIEHDYDDDYIETDDYNSNSVQPSKIYIHDGDFNAYNYVNILDNSTWCGYPVYSEYGWIDGHKSRDLAIYSYDTINFIIDRISNRSHFPNLKKITLYGFSAGAQIMIRHALVPRYKEDPSISVRYVISDPSTYIYLNKKRPKTIRYQENETVWKTKVVFEVPNSSWDIWQVTDYGHPWIENWKKDCHNYDNFRFGLTNLTAYYRHFMLPDIKDSLIEAFGRKDITYLVGVNDTKNCRLHHFHKCHDNGLAEYCAGMLQGDNRFDRTVKWMEFLRYYYNRDVHNFTYVKTAGHNHVRITQSHVGRCIIFGLCSYNQSYADDLIDINSLQQGLTETDSKQVGGKVFHHNDDDYLDDDFVDHNHDDKFDDHDDDIEHDDDIDYDDDYNDDMDDDYMSDDDNQITDDDDDNDDDNDFINDAVKSPS